MSIHEGESSDYGTQHPSRTCPLNSSRCHEHPWRASLKVGFTQGSPQRVPLRHQDQAWGHRHFSGEEGMAAKSFHCCMEWRCCPWFSIRWQRQAMPALAQNPEETGNPWIQLEIWIFAFFVSGATGISWLIRGSLKVISSFRRPLCCPPPQPGDCDPSYSLLHSSAKTWISKDKCHRCSTSPVEARSLFVIAVSPVNGCSISLWADIFHPADVKSTSICSAMPYAEQLPHCGERRLWSAPFVYIIALVSGQLLGQRLMFFIYSLSALIWIFLCLFPTTKNSAPFGFYCRNSATNLRKSIWK